MAADNKVEFEVVPERLDYPKTEEATLKHWTAINAFKESVRRSEGLPEFSFYDGPPFATGLPHYGHLLAGTIKDIVCRYAHNTGHHVERRFGWDCHGLPVEYEIDKKLGIRGPDDVKKLGIANYNAQCRSIVMRYAEQWEEIVSRMGRWIDFKNDYKTLDINFMESVWWVFKQVYEKNLVYQGFKVMPYSTGCSTPVSNFEAGQNYRNAMDPAVIVKFPLEDEPETNLVAWTTTPWTLPSNLALCVHPSFVYVKVRDNSDGTLYILLKDRMSELFKEPKKKEANAPPAATILEEFPGERLKGRRYRPLFTFFWEKMKDRAFRVVCDEYVTSDSGTGIVHQAPAFGEDDYRVCITNGIIEKGADLPCPIDDQGCFTEQVPDYVGRLAKEADSDIMRQIKGMGRLANQGTLLHSIPLCYRSETPLLYKAVPSWFIDVPQLKEKLLANNLQTYWVPSFVQEKRFHNWLADAREWCISRNRFWGTPLPVWISEDGEEIRVLGSVAELEEETGVKITDLHRENIDHLKIKSKKGKGMLKRVEEVFDCWFESGSMPYAQQHYPFENKDLFERDYFPADFIAEGLDQTRGWFYTLLVLSTALFDKPPFKNLIVNGLVLAGDGKKMSKRLKNYPDPVTEIINVYGADALRLYLIDSPVVRAEPLKFQSEGVLAVIRDVFNPWFNAYRFFINYAQRLQDESNIPFVANYTPPAGTVPNVMDKWILSAVQSLVEFVREEMKAYRLYTVVPRLVSFIQQLTNWYVRLNRPRLKGHVTDEDARVSLSVLWKVLYKLCLTMAPFTPFLVEFMYQNLRLALPANQREDSVHFLRFPSPDAAAIDANVERAVKRMQSVIELARVIRERIKKPVKQPLKGMVLLHGDPEFRADVTSLREFIVGECNVRDVIVHERAEDYVTLHAEPIKNVLGKKVGNKMAALSEAIKALTNDQCTKFKKSGKLTVDGFELTLEDVKFVFEYNPRAGEELVSHTDDDVIVLLNTAEDRLLVQEGMARELLNRTQRLRKKLGLQIQDECNIFFSVDGPAAQLVEVVAAQEALFTTVLRRPIYPESLRAALSPLVTVVGTQDDEIDGPTDAIKVRLSVTRVGLTFNPVSLLRKCNGDAARVADLERVVYCKDQRALRALKPNAKLEVNLNDVKTTLVVGEDIFWSLEALLEKEPSLKNTTNVPNAWSAPFARTA